MLLLARMPLDLNSVSARPPSQLDDPALLAMTLNRSLPDAAKLLVRFGGLHGLARTSFAELAAARVPLRRALQLHAALELGRRSLAIPLPRGALVNNPQAVVEAMRAKLAALEQEQLLVIGVDSQLRVVVEVVAAIGTIDGVACLPSDVLRPLILAGAHAFIVAHNHPSGVARPSDHDRELTRRLQAVGAMVGIELKDHVVVGHEACFSFAAQGKLGS